MADVLSKEQRSRCMSAIRSKNTRPELLVRKLVFAMGYRYRLHDSTLAGKPDLVFRKAKKVIFVHGCFWHLHSCRFGKVKPATNAGFWSDKRLKNVERDERNEQFLKAEGWQILVVWECETKDIAALSGRLKAFLQRQ